MHFCCSFEVVCGDFAAEVDVVVYQKGDEGTGWGQIGFIVWIPVNAFLGHGIYVRNYQPSYDKTGTEKSRPRHPFTGTVLRILSGFVPQSRLLRLFIFDKTRLYAGVRNFTEYGRLPLPMSSSKRWDNSKVFHGAKKPRMCGFQLCKTRATQIEKENNGFSTTIK